MHRTADFKNGVYGPPTFGAEQLNTRTTASILIGKPSSSARRAKPVRREPIATHQADVALCDVRDIMAMTRMGKSFLYAAVRDGTFPAPVIKRPRCTRWRLADVRNYLLKFGANAQASATATNG